VAPAPELGEMNIPIPQWLVNLWTAFGDRANVWVWRHGEHEVRRIDILMAIMFLACVATYWVIYGWQGALQGGIAFIVMSALALFMRR
jgi:hypothetical protein